MSISGAALLLSLHSRHTNTGRGGTVGSHARVKKSTQGLMSIPG